tara:strand:- start:296 stop:544 length:249 start_codon:yes stop_codon:yes gene_type:complete
MKILCIITMSFLLSGCLFATLPIAVGSAALNKHHHDGYDEDIKALREIVAEQCLVIMDLAAESEISEENLVRLRMACMVNSE